MAGRKCVICSHSQTSKINRAIAEGVSFRDIEGRFDVSKSSVPRHVENCLKLSLSAFIEQKLEKQAIDVHKEFEENLAFARDLRTAARRWLTVADIIDLDARATEVTVVYNDLNDLTKQGEPKQKKLKLDVLLELATTDAKEPQFAIVKTMDLRKFALDAISAADTCIDKFARLSGMYSDKSERTVNLNINRVVLPPLPEGSEIFEMAEPPLLVQHIEVENEKAK